MADPKTQQVYPLAPANGYPRSDEESQYEKEEKRKKRMKWAIYISAFAVFQVIVILVFVMVIMKVRTPKFRVGTLDIQTLNAQNTSSFDMEFKAPIRVKNDNFGPYKYDATSAYFYYGGVQIGNIAIPKDKAGFKSTKKIDATVKFNSSALPSNSTLSSDLSLGVLKLTSKGQMNGKVTIMFIFKKKKSTEMDCTTTINVSTQKVETVTCE